MKRIDAGVTLSIFVLTLAFYIRTLAPTLLYGDSAEFQTIAHTLGIGHPTGYPVYVLIAKVFTYLPFGDTAYRVNLLSAAAAALTVSLVYLILRKLGAWRIPAALSVFLLAFTGLFWKQAAIAEVYTLSAACLAFILYSMLAWKGSNNPRWLWAAGLAAGLSLGIHTTVALSGVAILLYLIPSTHRRIDWFQASLGVLTGVLLFLSCFLLLDHLNSPAGYYNAVVRHALSVWDMTPADFDSPFERLAFLYFPPQFSSQFFALPGKMVWEHLLEFFGGVSWDVVPAMLGIASLFIPRKDSGSRWREAILLLVAFVTFLLFAASYDVYDYAVFFLPAVLLLVIAIGLGFSALAELISRVPRIPKHVPGIVVGILILANVWISSPYLFTAWESRIPPFVDEYEAILFTFPGSRQYEAEQTLEYVEDNAILFTDWDHVYNYYYVAHVLQGRTGMEFHETYPQEGVTRLADSTLEYIAANIDARPIYFNERPSGLPAGYKITRAGSGLFRIERK